MVGISDTWWWAAAVPATLVVGKLALGSRRSKKGSGDVAPLREADESQVFVCERVCTSSRLISQLGGLPKDSYPGSCVTVCGVSDADACQEACDLTVCQYKHQVPDWNDKCQRRCTQECIRGRTAN